MKDRCLAWNFAVAALILLGSAFAISVLSRIFDVPGWKSLAHWLFYIAIMLPLTVLAVFLGLCAWDDHKKSRDKSSSAIPQSCDDESFLAECGVSDEEDKKKLALAVRRTLADKYGLAYEKVQPALRWRDCMPKKHCWSIVDCWKYLESVQQFFERELIVRSEDPLLFPVEGIEPETTVKDFVLSFLDIYDRYEHITTYLPPPELTTQSKGSDAVVRGMEQLKSRYVFLQNGTSEQRKYAINQILERYAGDYTIYHIPSEVVTPQDYWRAMHTFAPMGPLYEVDGLSGLDMESDYFERIQVIDQRPDNLLFVWEEVSEKALSEMMGFMLEDYYEMAWMRKPGKIRFLVSLSQPMKQFSQIELCYCPESINGKELAERVIAICDLDMQKTEARL